MMVKHSQTDGYTLMEMMFVLVILSVMMLLTVPIIHSNRDVVFVKSKIDEMVMAQYEAIVESESLVYEDADNDISVYYSRLGLVRHADTLYINGHRVIISLGTGWLYEKE